MKTLTLLLVLLLCLSPLLGYSQTPDSVFVPYKAFGYKYLVVKSSDAATKTFMKPAASESGWSTGQGAVGTLNNTTSPPVLSILHPTSILPGRHQEMCF